MNLCVFCDKDLGTEKTIELQEKGSISMNNVSSERGDSIIDLLELDRLFMRNVDQIYTTQTFLQVKKYLEVNEDEQTTIKDLTDYMKSLSKDEAYSHHYMKIKLKRHYGMSIRITSNQTAKTTELHFVRLPQPYCIISIRNRKF